MRRVFIPEKRVRSVHGPRVPAVRPAGLDRRRHHHPVPVRKRGGPPRWALILMRKRPARRGLTLLLAILGLVLIVGVSGARVARQNVGYVGVVRNGGPLDNIRIRQVLLPGQRLTWIGLFSQAPHEYPASTVSRAYKVTGDPKKATRPGVTAITVPTRDGVQVGIEATVFVRFIGESNIAVLKRFDNAYASRRFPTPDGRQLYPWQGDDGFYAILDAIFQPVLAYDIRKELGRFQCAALVASCALVSQGAAARKVPLANADAIADRISTTVNNDLVRTLGEPYFRNIRVRISRVVLPPSVQSAIDRAQAEYAGVSGARALLQQARYTAETNRLIGDSLNRSPALATVEALKALPKNATVIVSSGGKTPTILAGAGGAVGAATTATNGGSTATAPDGG